MQYQKTVLKNGVQLITAPLDGTKAVTLLILLPVGSRYETKDINGVSHFVEHLMFKGTEKRPTSLDISKELDAIGAEFNAFTSKDYTGYYIKAAADKIELAFDILSDMLLHSTFDEKEINKERGVIIQEINMYEDNPLMSIGDYFEQTVFGDHPLGRSIAGPKTVIEKISRKKIITYRDKHYRPNQLTISVAGAQNPVVVRKLTERYFGSATGKAKSGYQRVSGTQNSPRVKLRYKDSHQVQLALGFPSFGATNPKNLALHLLEVIMGGNMSSRLFTVVREEHGLCYYVRMSGEPYRDTGSTCVYAGLDKDRLEKAIKLILSELKKAAEVGVTSKELDDAKEFYRGKMILAFEDSEHLADWYAKMNVFYPKIQTPEERIEKFMKVTTTQVNAVAKEVLNPRRLNLALIGPFKSEQHFKKLLRF